MFSSIMLSLTLLILFVTPPALWVATRVAKLFTLTDDRSRHEQAAYPVRRRPRAY